MRWRSFSHTIFDCDSTLSSIEGIDELAVLLNQKEAVEALTNAAMDGEVDLKDVYGKRLELLQPSKQQVRSLKEAYKTHTVPHAKEVIAALTDQKVTATIVSGGLQEAVEEYGVWLGIDAENIHAVGARYDPLSHRWWLAENAQRQTFIDHEVGALTDTVGKGDVIKTNVPAGRRIMIGDGASDLATQPDVDLFVAYSGVVDRHIVTSQAAVVITSFDIAPLLALVLGPAAVVALLESPHNAVAKAALTAIENGALVFNDKTLETKFFEAFGQALL